MKRIVLKSAMEDERSKIKAMKAIAEVGVDMKKGKIIVVGKADPVCVAMKVRKLGYGADLLSVASANAKDER